MRLLLAFTVGLLVGPVVLVTLARLRWSTDKGYIRDWHSAERRQMIDYDRTGDSVM